jgi:hypothetical protein
MAMIASTSVLSWIGAIHPPKTVSVPSQPEGL